jgi:hypothetical protein
MKRFEIEYKDCTGMKCMVDDILSTSEKEAVIKLQLELIGNNDIMTELIYVEELVEDLNDGEWSIKDGPVLDQDSQDALNDAMSSYTNSEGLTLEQAMERASQHKNK